jgi:hypothetical protein
MKKLVVNSTGKCIDEQVDIRFVQKWFPLHGMPKLNMMKLKLKPMRQIFVMDK